MRNFILGFLLALSVSTTAVTMHKDGSVTFTEAEFDILSSNITAMNSDINTAIHIIKRLHEDLEAVQKAKCI